ncbi:hypothetical protein EUTSA_v10003056mg [Eutrema salsugineum]|uniref:YDG domain-containing protein n=1 Tax=Eutrema salsugineum TaxID=72664 RepID=V4KZZ9_EUTSA|nr:YDG domain-containing protein At5g47150 [Eutrema salsugineum]XP_024009655.1 YDG domain-containing protein At5g47150 [Eutrema salsugineum]ESQ36959.1 hypothetical protein EUTSA_v10003056mg [Eutrema salsugineum]
MTCVLKRRIVYAIRDFPPGCGTHSDTSGFNHPQRSIKNPRIDHVFASREPFEICLKPEQEFEYADDYDLVAVPKPKGTCLKQEPEIRNSVHGHGRFDAALRSSEHDPTPREKVLEALRIYKEIFRELEREKQARVGGDLFCGRNRIDLKTQAVLEKMGKQVNTEKRIGSVPGIKVGDVFQYKTELLVVGLHFKNRCGIDFMKAGDVNLATSIVASEGYGYGDKFDSGVIVYTGEGGNVISKEKKTEDQKLIKGNLALANSMKKKSLVRVIRGEGRLDRKGKRYVYDGLYLVEKYWSEKDVRGKTVYKFKRCRIPGQPRLSFS